MRRLIDGDALYEKASDLEAQALDYAVKISNDEEKREEWIRWSAILAERTAFKHDVYDAPTIEPEPQWIPCSERLPDAPLRKTGDEDFEWFEGEQVLICDKDGLIHVAYIVKDYIFNDIYWCATDVDELRGEEVKAWMPLPAPYKEDTE